MKKSTYKKTAAWIVLLAVLLTGCAGKVADQNTKTSETGSASESKDTSGSGESDNKTVTTKEGKTVDVSGVTLRIAAASGTNGQTVIEAAGLDNTPYKVEFSILQGGNKVMEALAADQIDLGAGSQIPPLAASQASNQGNFKIIAVRYGSTLNQELIAAPDSEITSVEELKGKKVGYVKNTTAQYFLAKMLESAGLGWDDIDAQAFTTSDGATAILTGDIDAWASYDNSIRVPKQNGSKTIESAQDILSGNYLFYATPAAIEDEATHAAIEDWLNRWHEAHAWARENDEKWAEFYAPTVSQDVDEYLEQFREQNGDKIYACKPITDEVIADEQDIADTLEGLGTLTSHVDVKELFDDSFTEAVEGFTKYD
ncbi:ABC transporter substrate-binding protein [Hespellia stercorisuis]|uniref:Sulfonate transport system substrate-binding protein n=1 Tax=Hespellia stercorisuis DSM 15480 TaxID=1121950 RepID=A0A1M6JWB4_9FIRM|nr:ABC transporter substrate-binding protein [Hespellia stercorisuis]SHJ50943.1 sulfonate transport system substrate-binding protein [Hespellia stercorisuis DSM 15480]